MDNNNNQIDIKINSLLQEISEKTYLLAQQNEAIYKLQQENKELKDNNNQNSK